MTVKEIHDVHVLLEWLAKRLLAAQPRGHISNGFVELFHEFVTELSDETFSRALLLENVFQVMARNPGMTRSHYNLPAFLAKFGDYACFGPGDEAFNHNNAVPVFIDLANQHLKLALKIKWKDDTLTVKSQGALVDRERVWIKVVYRADDYTLI